MTDSELTASAEPRLSWAGRLTDRINPILVREVQQVLKSRVFVGTIAFALVSIVGIALAIAAEGRTFVSVPVGFQFFVIGLILLVPIVIFVVPLQAFMSMRDEVTGGTSEQLLLTSLTPGRIVRGKLASTMLLFVIYLSLFAPLLAMTFLLRGVDVALIALMIMLVALATLAATSVAIALGALARFKAVRSGALAFAGFVLGGAAIGGMAGMWDTTREMMQLLHEPSLLWIAAVIAVGGGFALVLCAMVAASTLTHPYENRSTGFRSLAVAAIVAAYVLLVTNPWGDLDDGGPILAALIAIASVPFWLFAVSEDVALSPRVCTLVPRRRWCAAFSVPFLPGCGRGLLLTLILAVMSVGLGVLVPAVFEGRMPRSRDVGYAVLAWLYVVFYATLVLRLRRVLRAGPWGIWFARAAGPVMLGLCCVIPVLFDVVIQGEVGRWHWFHLGDPFFTFSANWRYPWQPIAALAVVDAVLVAVSLPDIAAGAREVFEASRAKRFRAV